MPQINVNGKMLDYAADDGTPLLWVLREQLGLTGTSTAAALRSVGRVPCTLMASPYAPASCPRPR